jgi:hypothetical protein
MKRCDRLARLERQDPAQERRVLVLDPLPGESLADTEARQFPDLREGDVAVLSGVPRVQGSTMFALANAENSKSRQVLSYDENLSFKR